jgi:hypothetical protein
MSSIIRTIRKTSARLTGIHGLFSGKGLTPLDPVVNLPTLDEDSLSIAENPAYSTKQILNRQISIDHDKLNNIYEGNKMDFYLAKTINISGLYSKFYKSLTSEERYSIWLYQAHSTWFYNQSHMLIKDGKSNTLKSVFSKAPGIPSTIHVYRCFKDKVSLNKLIADGKLGVFLSTSLSHKFVLEWCENNTTTCYKNKNKTNFVEI